MGWTLALASVALFACGRIEFGYAAFGGDAVPPSDTAVTISGLVGCWTFDEGSGTTASDCSGDASVGTLGGAAMWTTGKMNSAISFSGGATDTVVVASTSLFDFGTSSFSYGLWVKLEPTATSGYEVPMWKGGSSTFYTGYDLEYDVAGMTWDISLSDGVSLLPLHSPMHDYRDAIWHHVFAVIDRSASTESLYVDGALVAGPSSIATLGSVTSTNVLKFDGDYAPMFGAVDEGRIYSRALMASEVAGLCASPGSR